MERKDENGKLKDTAHNDDHDFIYYLKENLKKQRELKDKVIASLITAFLWSLVSGIGAIIWYAFNERIDK